MLRHSFDMDEAAEKIEQAISQVLDEGYRSADIAGEGDTPVNTKSFGNLISERLS